MNPHKAEQSGHVSPREPETPQAPAPPDHRAASALLLCRAEPEAVGPVARLPCERVLHARTGPRRRVLVPERKPWPPGGEPVGRVLTGWDATLSVGASWPVLALWWDARPLERSGWRHAVRAELDVVGSGGHSAPGCPVSGPSGPAPWRSPR